MFTLDEIDKAINKLKYCKAAGNDGITAEVLRKGGKAMCQMLLKICSEAWIQGKVPSEWSKMVVAPIHKKGDKLQPESYRAMALHFIPGKVFSRVILNRMQNKIEQNLSESQVGFRRGKSTVDAIFVARQIVINPKEYNVALKFNFIDFKASFDTILRTALWKMMRAIGMSDKLVSLIKALYKNT